MAVTVCKNCEKLNTSLLHNGNRRIQKEKGKEQQTQKKTKTKQKTFQYIDS